MTSLTASSAFSPGLNVDALPTRKSAALLRAEARPAPPDRRKRRGDEHSGASAKGAMKVGQAPRDAGPRLASGRSFIPHLGRRDHDVPRPKSAEDFDHRNPVDHVNPAGHDAAQG